MKLILIVNLLVLVICVNTVNGGDNLTTTTTLAGAPSSTKSVSVGELTTTTTTTTTPPPSGEIKKGVSLSNVFLGMFFGMILMFLLRELYQWWYKRRVNSPEFRIY